MGGAGAGTLVVCLDFLEGLVNVIGKQIVGGCG
jgi:hypothetical protein